MIIMLLHFTWLFYSSEFKISIMTYQRARKPLKKKKMRIRKIMAFDEDVDRMQKNSMIVCLFITKGKLDVCRKILI